MRRNSGLCTAKLAIKQAQVNPNRQQTQPREKCQPVRRRRADSRHTTITPVGSFRGRRCRILRAKHATLRTKRKKKGAAGARDLSACLGNYELLVVSFRS